MADDWYKYTINEADLRDASNFLATFLKEQIPDGNFEKGSATYDLLITGFSAMYAFLRGEIDRATAKQSLKRIQEEFTDADDIQQSVNEVLSNWFVTRKGGTYATTYARLHLQTQLDTRTIPATAEFWKTSSLKFVVDTNDPSYVISSLQQLPVYDSRGRLVEFVCDVPLIAAKPGSAYRVTAGKFIKVVASTGLSDLIYAEVVDDVSGGADVESTEQLIDRTETVISVRNLINNRSCDVTLQNAFPAIQETMSVGMGEPEMIRDMPREIGAHLGLHIGGALDTYLTTDRTLVTESCVVGGFYPRPDGLINVFRDPGMTSQAGLEFDTRGVLPGHILRLYSGVAGSPQTYIIATVTPQALYVSESNPFAEVTTPDMSVYYSIGASSPDFADLVAYRVAAADPGDSSIPVGTSNSFQEDRAVLLTSGPILDIRSVEIARPNLTTSTMVNAATGKIVFYQRVNGIPVNSDTLTEPGDTQYQIRVLNPEKAQSMAALNVLSLGADGDFAGATLQVTYETFTTFSTIHSYVLNQSRRVLTANHLVRARHPVWISFEVSYKASESATLDEAGAASAVAEFINAFKDILLLDSSDIVAFLRNTYSVLTTVYPVIIYYTLNAPDGQQAMLSTTDEVSIYITDGNGVVLENGAAIATPAELIANGKVRAATINNATDLQAWYTWMGVTDRTTSYRTRADLITFERRFG
jgi:hypothetical protein